MTSGEKEKLKNTNKDSSNDHSPVPKEELQASKRLQLLYALLTVVLCGVSFILGAKNPTILANIASAPAALTSDLDDAHIVLTPLWATALVRSHLRTHPGIPSIEEFNERLAQAVIRDHDAYVRKKTESFEDMDATAKEILNDDFFFYQVGDDEEKDEDVVSRLNDMEHRQSAEFQLLTNCIAQLASRVLEKYGKGVHDRSQKRLQSWTTLHRNGSRHGLHMHPGNTLSIVYYVKLGERGGGALQFYDPRGPRTPFDDKIELKPEEGEVVVFPGWLAHEVDGSVGTRISIVFNVPGPWEGTALGGMVESLGQWDVANIGGVSKAQRPTGWVLDYEL